jgi:hypothetical protein
MLGVGRSKDAENDFRQAVSEAERLRHSPSLWLALAGLAEVLQKTGRDGDAEETRDRAREILEGFAANLSPAHQRMLESSPQVAQVLAR